MGFSFFTKKENERVLSRQQTVIFTTAKKKTIRCLMKYKKISEHPAYENNPFVEEALEGIQKQTVRRTRVIRPDAGLSKQVQQIVVNADGEATGYGAFMQYIEVDEEQFAKVYLSQFAAFWELSKPAIRVFGYILSALKPGQDRLIFRMDKALAYTNYSHRSHVLTGLSNLVECGIIARTAYEYEYFINPLVFFNGNRVTFAKTYIKRKKGQADVHQLSIFDPQEDGAPLLNE